MTDPASSDSAPLRTRNFGLDVARATAVMSVLLAHFVGHWQVLGFYGVELFFALSGFLIGSIFYRNLMAPAPFSLQRVRNFWMRRWWRTLPNYYLFLIISAAFAYFYGGMPAPKNFLPYLVFWQSMTGSVLGFYAVSWSLCVEEWFYFLFPLLILLFVKLRLPKERSFLLTTVLFLVVPITLREMLFPLYSVEAIRQTTIARLDAIFYGVAVAFGISHFTTSSSFKKLAFFAGLMSVLLMFTLELGQIDNGDKNFFKIAFIAVPAGFALMLPLLQQMENPAPKFSLISNWVTNTSLWSYSIYLCHIPLLFVIYSAFGALRSSESVNVLSKIVAFIAVLLVSRLAYLHFEAPLTRKRPPEYHG